MTAVVTVQAALKEGWLTDAARLRCGLKKRPVAGVPHMNLKLHPEYVQIVHELDMFIAWLMWFETPKAKRGLRPEVWKRTPAYAWKVQGEYHVKKHKPSPEPPPGPAAHEPPSRWENAPWCKPFVDISHGLRDENGVWTVEQLVDICLRYGAKAVFFQFGDDCPDHDWARHGRQLYEAAKPRGLDVGGWGRGDYTDWAKVKADIRSVLPLDGLKIDVEQRCQDQQLPEHLRDEFADETRLAVVATGGIDQSFDGHTPQQAAARWGDWFDFVGQDYYKVNATPTPLALTPDGGENFVYWRSTAKIDHGFRHLPDAGNKYHVTQFMPNAEGCPPLLEQEERLKAWEGAKGVWDGELVEGGGEWPVFQRIVAS